MNTESMIHAAYAKSGLSYETLGKLMSNGEAGDSKSTVGRIFSKEAGVKIDVLGKFLNALGLKIVPKKSVVIREEHLRALLAADKELNRIITARLDSGLPVGEGE